MNNMSEKSIRIYPKDAPWITVKLKELIRLRQAAFHINKEGQQYKALRNAVNRERKLCKTRYYASKVEDLKGVNPRKWWKEVKKLSGSTKKDSFDLLNDLAVPEFEEMSRQEIANAINLALLAPLQTFESFDPSTVYLALEDDVEFLEVSTYRVYNCI